MQRLALIRPSRWIAMDISASRLGHIEFTSNSRRMLCAIGDAAYDDRGIPNLRYWAMAIPVKDFCVN